MGLSNTQSTALIARSIAESAWVRLYNNFPFNLVTRATGSTGFVMPEFVNTTDSGIAITTESGLVSTQAATAFVVGATYTIATIGTTTTAQWLAAGVTGAADTTAGAFVVGTTYRILTAGTTNFTLVGAANSTVGTVFVATGVGTGTGTVSNVLVGGKFTCIAVTSGTGTAVADGYVSTDIAMTASVTRTTTDLNTYRAQVIVSNELLKDSTIQEVLTKRLSGQLIEQVGNAIVGQIALELYTNYRFTNEVAFNIGTQADLTGDTHSGFACYSRLQNQYRQRACWIFSPSGFRSYGTQEGRLNLSAYGMMQGTDSTVDLAGQGGNSAQPQFPPLQFNPVIEESKDLHLEKRSKLNYELNQERIKNAVAYLGCPAFVSDGLGVTNNQAASGTTLTNSSATFVVGSQYMILTLGTTTTSQWNALGASGTPYVGQVFSALITTSAGTGTTVLVTSKTIWMVLVDLSSYLLFDQPLQVVLDTESRAMFNQTVVHCIYRANGLLIEPQAGWCVADPN